LLTKRKNYSYFYIEANDILFICSL